jgi:hypothetical protein
MWLQAKGEEVCHACASCYKLFSSPPGAFLAPLILDVCGATIKRVRDYWSIHLQRWGGLTCQARVYDRNHLARRKPVPMQDCTKADFAHAFTAMSTLDGVVPQEPAELTVFDQPSPHARSPYPCLELVS